MQEKKIFEEFRKHDSQDTQTDIEDFSYLLTSGSSIHDLLKFETFMYSTLRIAETSIEYHNKQCDFKADGFTIAGKEIPL